MVCIRGRRKMFKYWYKNVLWHLLLFFCLTLDRRTCGHKILRFFLMTNWNYSVKGYVHSHTIYILWYDVSNIIPKGISMKTAPSWSHWGFSKLIFHFSRRVRCVNNWWTLKTQSKAWFTTDKKTHVESVETTVIVFK